MCSLLTTVTVWQVKTLWSLRRSKLLVILIVKELVSSNEMLLYETFCDIALVANETGCKLFIFRPSQFGTGLRSLKFRYVQQSFRLLLVFRWSNAMFILSILKRNYKFCGTLISASLDYWFAPLRCAFSGHLLCRVWSVVLSLHLRAETQLFCWWTFVDVPLFQPGWHHTAGVKQWITSDILQMG